jgi:hypothetical protein
VYLYPSGRSWSAFPPNHPLNYSAIDKSRSSKPLPTKPSSPSRSQGYSSEQAHRRVARTLVGAAAIARISDGISNVLSVISRSPNELQPVLDEIASTAANLCEADTIISLERAGELHLSRRIVITIREKGPIDRRWTMDGRSLVASPYMSMTS